MVSIAFHSSSPSRSRILLAPRPSVSHRVLTALGTLKTEWQVRRTVKAVEALDAHLLQDMGLARGGVEDAVRHGRHAA